MGILDRFKKQEEEVKSPEKRPEKKNENKPGSSSVKKGKTHERSFDPSLVPAGGKETVQKKDSTIKETAKNVSKKVQREDTKDAYKVLVRPIITEKANVLGAGGQYVFEVFPSANKVEVKKAIRNLYGVTVVKVRIINNRGKRVQYGRHSGSTKYWKKAIVSLKPGDKIEIFEGV